MIKKYLSMREMSILSDFYTSIREKVSSSLVNPSPPKSYNIDVYSTILAGKKYYVRKIDNVILSFDEDEKTICHGIKDDQRIDAKLTKIIANELINMGIKISGSVTITR
jgi:hypothetical protein